MRAAALFHPAAITYLNNRYYDPALGNFVSVDPLVGKTGTPYLYANGNPATFSDPSGLDRCDNPSNPGKCNTFTGSGPKEPSSIEVPVRAAPRTFPSGEKSAACQQTPPDPVNCFIDGKNSYGATEDNTPQDGPIHISDEYTRLLGDNVWCSTHISDCIDSILAGAADLYAEHDVARRHELNEGANELALALISATDGISCASGSFGMTVCVGGDVDLPFVHAPHLRGGTTIGDFYFTDNDPAYLTTDRIWHESVHAWQWAAAAELGYNSATYAVMYTLAGTSGTENLFEQQADLCKGGYIKC